MSRPRHLYTCPNKWKYMRACGMFLGRDMLIHLPKVIFGRYKSACGRINVYNSKKKLLWVPIDRCKGLVGNGFPRWEMISHGGKWFPTVGNDFPRWEMISHGGIQFWSSCVALIGFSVAPHANPSLGRNDFPRFPTVGYHFPRWETISHGGKRFETSFHGGKRFPTKYDMLLNLSIGTYNHVLEYSHHNLKPTRLLTTFMNSKCTFTNLGRPHNSTGI